MAERTIKAILFDVGETLLDFGRVNTTRLFREGARRSHTYLKRMNQPVAPFEIYFWKNLFHLRWRTLKANLTGVDFDAFTLLKEVGRKTGVRLTEEQWREYAWQWYTPLDETGRVQDGTVDALGVLRDAGMKMGLVSNTFVNRDSLDRHMDRFGILEFFPLRIYSYECPRRKPNPVIFELAAERIGEPYENIAFVGDRIDTDIEPALRLGMTAIMRQAYTNVDKSVPQGAITIRQIAELPGILLDADG